MIISFAFHDCLTLLVIFRRSLLTTGDNLSFCSLESNHLRCHIIRRLWFCKSIYTGLIKLELGAHTKGIPWLNLIWSERLQTYALFWLPLPFSAYPQCLYSFPCEQVAPSGDSVAPRFHTAGTVLRPIWFGGGPAGQTLRESHHLASAQLFLG